METVCQAIAHYEGFFKPGSRASRNNNPGNIEYGELAKRWGATLESVRDGVDEKARFACFSSVVDGFGCLSVLLNQNYSGLTVLEAFNKYAPPSENNTNAYAEFVCEQTGLQLNSVLNAENIG